MSIDIQRINMVRNQIRPAGVEDSNIINAMLQIPRHHFVAQKFASVAYSDAELPILNDDSRLTARPEMIAKLLSAAEITKDDDVLEIGCSTGYATAIIAHIAQYVIGIDSCKKSITKAKKIAKDLALTNVEFHQQDLEKVFDISNFSLIIINGAIFTKDPYDISHVQDKNDLFDLRSRDIFNNLLENFHHKIIAVEGYYKYSPMHIVKYHQGARQIIDEIYMPVLPF